jgi:putative flavoprotein involved in K+ transport
MTNAPEAAEASLWLEQFDSALARRDAAGAAALFGAEAYWRDIVAFTWNIRTFESRAEIETLLDATLASGAPSQWRVESAGPAPGGLIEAWLRFETAAGRGRAIVRLKDGKAFTLLTTLEELKGFEERSGRTRPPGLEHGVYGRRPVWSETRAAEQAALGTTAQPYCLIVGGGQGGIALAARLKQLGVPAIVLETNAHAGDSWRRRYRTLVLHDPVWYDHLPYIPFPDNWPVFTPKDKLGDWLEMYVRVMELDYWTNAEARSAHYDRVEKTWRVEVEREGRRIELRPRQLVFATGAYGPPNEPVFEGADAFDGEILHSSRYQTGRPYEGKHCLVVGANSSAHDVAADLWEFGARVTMLQRSSTTVVKSETFMEMAFAPLYSEAALENGITTEKADLIFASTPFALMPRDHIPLWREIRKRDHAFYERLAAAGFRLDFGADESGLSMKAWRSGAGYYIDVGASELIASGKIPVRAGEIRRLKRHSVEFTDGSEQPADVIVCATGFQSMNRTVAQVVSEAVADKVGKCWGLGSGTPGDPGPWEGEPRNMWKPTQQEGLWFHGGNLHLSRFYSLYLALQLKARMEGLATPVYGLQKVHHTR